MGDNPFEALTLEDLRARTSAKWRLYPADVLPLWVAEMDVALAPAVVEAVTSAVERGDTGYSFGTGYAEAFADFADARWGWGFEAERTRLVPDVMRGIVEVLRLVSGPGDAVVVNSPVYPPFYEFVSHAGRRVVEAPLGDDGRLDLAVLEGTFQGLREAGGRPVYLLCSPHNPTGTVHTREELLGVNALAEEYGVRVVVDEIHAPLVYPGARHLPYLSLPGTQRAFAAMSASKAWNLPGIKAAIVVAGTGAVDELREMPQEVSFGASHLGVIAHVAGLRHGREWLEEVLGALDDNRRLLGDLLAEHLPGVGYVPPEGTYLAWLDCRPLGLGEDPTKVFLDRGRVALNAGPTFGTGGAGHARLNLATSPAILTDAVRRMASVL